MIKFISKYYLQFPPVIHRAVDISLTGILSYAGVDFYEPSAENILLGTNELTKKLFV